MERHKKTQNRPAAERPEGKALHAEKAVPSDMDPIEASAQANGASPEPKAGEDASDSSTSFPRWKRVLDLTCIALALPFWLPLMVCLALGITILSPGPVFFRQERVGYRGRRFRCLKFRSMKVNAETQIHERHLERLMQADCPMTKLDRSGDPRLIPLGRILRASGLDELPQLFNVVRGEMSLVGPRPCTATEFANYGAWQRKRFSAPPGLTGYWQVNGKNETSFSTMIEMDIYYARHMSLWMDLWIMLKTAPAIARQVFGSRIQAPTEGTKQNCS
ncbi:MAG: sugar transferase [Verrucomicrobia bacterium]|nr:sugar transferase [Verrucomicrobiota bacterium]